MSQEVIEITEREVEVIEITEREVEVIEVVERGPVGPVGPTAVTSVGISGSDGIEVDSGSPVTGAGTIALGVNAATLRSHINVADGAEVNVNADWNASSGDAQILNKPTLGGAAALNVGTTTGTVAAGDDSRFTDAASLTSGTLADARLSTNVSRVMHGIAVGIVLN